MSWIINVIKRLFTHYNVFVDMDGVIADIEAAINFLARYASEPGFFRSLSPIKHNLKYVKKLNRRWNVSLYIISAVPNMAAAEDKWYWIQKYLPRIKRKQVIFCPVGADKSDYVGNLHGILLDDYRINIQKWVAKKNNYAYQITDDMTVKMFYDSLKVL